MAGEIRLTTSIVVNNGALVSNFSPGTISIDQTTAAVSGGSQIINGTTAEVITITDITTAGIAAFRNQSTTLTIEVGTGTGTSFAPLLSLKPLEVAVGRLATTQPTARVTTVSNATLWCNLFAA